jgi:plastocyanin
MVISVEAGNLITWTNKDDIVESVTSSTGQFDGIITSHGSYSFQFSTPGTYPYYSRMNPNLTGKVIVN